MRSRRRVIYNYNYPTTTTAVRALRWLAGTESERAIHLAGYAILVLSLVERILKERAATLYLLYYTLRIFITWGSLHTDTHIHAAAQERWERERKREREKKKWYLYIDCRYIGTERHHHTHMHTITCALVILIRYHTTSGERDYLVTNEWRIVYACVTRQPLDYHHRHHHCHCNHHRGLDTLAFEKERKREPITSNFSSPDFFSFSPLYIHIYTYSSLSHNH